VLNGHLLWVKKSINDMNYETTEESSSSLSFSLPFIFHLLLSLTFPGRIYRIWELSAAIHLSRLKTHHHHHNHLTIKLYERFIVKGSSVYLCIAESFLHHLLLSIPSCILVSVGTPFSLDCLNKMRSFLLVSQCL
jgi:hypothetical protein